MRISKIIFEAYNEGPARAPVQRTHTIMIIHLDSQEETLVCTIGFFTYLLIFKIIMQNMQNKSMKGRGWCYAKRMTSWTPEFWSNSGTEYTIR